MRLELGIHDWVYISFPNDTAHGLIFDGSNLYRFEKDIIRLEKLSFLTTVEMKFVHF
jgi:hypothetical protein